MRLRLSDLKLLELTRWTADNSTASVCLAKGQKPVSIDVHDCQPVKKFSRRAGVILRTKQFNRHGRPITANLSDTILQNVY